MWTKQCLQEIVAPMGDLIGVDPQTKSFSSLEFAKVQIRTKKPGVLSLCRKIKVRDAVYTVNIVEDIGSLGPGTCEYPCNKCVREESAEGSLNLEVYDTNFSDSDVGIMTCGMIWLFPVVQGGRRPLLDRRRCHLCQSRRVRRQRIDNQTFRTMGPGTWNN